jgi:acyl carrier protein
MASNQELTDTDDVHPLRAAAEDGSAGRLKKVLRTQARFLSAGADIEPDMPLASLGVDSLDIIELVVKMEGEFDLDIPAQQVTPETFATPASIWRLLCQIDPTLAER